MPQDGSKILKTHKGYWINRVRTLIHNAFEARLACYDVSVAAWCVLVSLYDKSAQSVNELADYIEVDKASISRIVEKLTLKGFIKHETRKDRRSSTLSLTAAGEKLVPLLLQEATQNEQHFFGSLSEEEQEKLKNILFSLLSRSSSIPLEGWLSPPLTQENKMEKLKRILKEATEQRWPYPKTFEALKAAGLVAYEVQFVKHYRAFFIADSCYFEEGHLEGYIPPQVEASFHVEGLKKAIMHHATERTAYSDFLTEAAKNGVSHYNVDMKARTVTYFNADQTLSHQEQVPLYKE